MKRNIKLSDTYSYALTFPHPSEKNVRLYVNLIHITYTPGLARQNKNTMAYKLKHYLWSKVRREDSSALQGRLSRACVKLCESGSRSGTQNLVEGLFRWAPAASARGLFPLSHPPPSPASQEQMSPEHSWSTMWLVMPAVPCLCPPQGISYTKAKTRGRGDETPPTAESCVWMGIHHWANLIAFCYFQATHQYKVASLHTRCGLHCPQYLFGKSELDLIKQTHIFFHCIHKKAGTSEEREMHIGFWDLGLHNMLVFCWISFLLPTPCRQWSLCYVGTNVPTWYNTANTGRDGRDRSFWKKSESMWLRSHHWTEACCLWISPWKTEVGFKWHESEA